MAPDLVSPGGETKGKRGVTDPVSLRRRFADVFSGGEVGVIAATAVIAVGFLGFLGLADRIVDNHTVGFDQGLMLLLHPGGHSPPVGPAWLEAAAIDFTALGSITDLCLIVLLAAGLFAALGRWREAGWLVAAPLSGLILATIFKDAVGRQRPPLAMHAVAASNASFPSGHAMLSAIVYLTLAALVSRFAGRGRVAIYALACGLFLALAIGASRVYLGVHWPTDVIAGWALGAAWATLWSLAILWLGRRGRLGETRPGLDSSTAG